MSCLRRPLCLCALALALAASARPARAQFGGIKVPAPRLPSLPSFPNVPLPKPPPLPSLPPVNVPPIRLPDPRSWARVDTNRDSVKADLRRGWDLVAFSREIDHAKEAEFAAAVAASVASETPVPLKLYAQQLLRELKASLVRDLKHQAHRVLPRLTEQLVLEVVRNAIQGRPTLLHIEGVQVQVGLATYNHWKKVSTDYPRITRGRLTWDRIEKTLPLPNTFQVYVRARLVR